MYTYKKDPFFRDGSGVELNVHRVDRGEPEHLHEFIELVYVLRGSGVHGIDGVEYHVRRGSLLFINYRQVHYFRSDPRDPMEICDVLLDPEWLSQRLIGSENAFELLTLSAFSQFQQSVDPKTALVRFMGEERRRAEALIREMIEEKTSAHPGFSTVLKAQVSILLTMVFRKMSAVGVRYSGPDEEFLSYIRQNCTEKLTLEDLAKQCFYNPSYFSRIFRERYGMTVTEYINLSRLEKATDLLVQTDLSVEEILRRSGFSRKAGFYRCFKEKTGMTPQEYRKSKKA